MEENNKKIENNEEKYEPHKLKWWHAPLLVVLIVGTFFAMKERRNMQSSAATSEWNESMCKRSEGMIFGTVYHITYNFDDDLSDSIKAVLDEIDASLSPFNKESVITAINNNENMQTDARFAEVFNLSKTISAETDGAFDITVAPLVNAWGFGFKNMKDVTDSQIDSLMAFVGIDKVELKDGKIVKSVDGLMLDCSAIAKGYGVDAVGKFLEKKGVKNYMVEIGGEVRLMGFNPKGGKWRIGVTKPEDDSLCQQQKIERVLELTDISMATSGNYRNYYEKDNRKYAHTIDPRTGYPVQHSILSSTVVARDCAVADAYATSFMVLGLDDAKKVLQRHPEIAAYFICSDDKGKTYEWVSESMKRMQNNKETK